jgi:hypothetical protein
MLAACRLAGLSALEAHYVSLKAWTQSGIKVVRKVRLAGKGRAGTVDTWPAIGQSSVEQAAATVNARPLASGAVHARPLGTVHEAARARRVSARRG